jgi:hypothetical protein
MKSLIKIITGILLLLLFTQCSNENIKVYDTNYVFVVCNIKRIDKTYSKYDNKNYNERILYKEIILPTGWYNVGDTIRLMPIKHCTETWKPKLKDRNK